jgi:sugar lactone lactonase YvrE
MTTVKRRTAPALLALVLTLAACAPAQPPAPAAPGVEAPVTRPDVIDLLSGFQPEGIAATGTLIYVGSIPTGAVYRADTATGRGSVVVPAADGRAAIGIKIDGRDRLIVCGGPTGKAFVYDAATGRDLASYTLSETTQTFINDVALSDDAAWFTDSRQAVIYRVSLPSDGTLGGQEAVTTLKLNGDFKFQAGAFNLNGIVWAGDRLIAVQSGAGLLFYIDPATGATRKIQLGGESVPNGDGLLLDGQTLFVVQNRRNQVAVIDLAADPKMPNGTVRTRITNPAFDVPTTLAAVGSSLYAVNARFDTTPTPSTPYTVVRFDKP